MEPLISALTEEEEEQFRNCIRRMNTVFQAAKELDVRCMVDAEQTYFQPAIARIAMEMMNRGIFTFLRLFLMICVIHLQFLIEDTHKPNEKLNLHFCHNLML